LTVTPLPKLGELVDLTFTVEVIRSDDQNQPAAGLTNSKAWLDFYWTNTQGSYVEAYTPVRVPVEEVVIDGELPWSGNYSRGLTLRSRIKLTREGIWNIRGAFYGEGWRAGAGAEMRVAVADGTAANMNTPDFKQGPLAYLGNLSHEGGVSHPIIAYEGIPVTLGLDLSRAPRVGEEVTLSCRITSVVDMPDISIEWVFYRTLGETTQVISPAEMLSSADLDWATDIRKGEPVVFSTQIKFPAEGEWEIVAMGKSGTRYLTGAAHRMRFDITPSKSYFGWVYTHSGEPTDTPTGTPSGVKAIYDTPTAH
jgi:hypothetical protein